RRSRPVIAWLATSSLVAIAAEGAIGGVVVANELAPWLVLVHLGLAMIILGCLLATAILALPASPGLPDRVKPFAAALGTYVLLLTGSTVVASEADETCRAWPLCGGGLAFDLSGANAFTMLHRGAVLAIGALMVYALWAAMRRAELRPGDGDAGRPPPPGRGRRGGGAHRRRALQRPARRDRDPRLGGHAGDRAAHAAARGPLARARPAQRGQTAGMSVLRDYLSLLKLRVVLLLDATAVGVMIPAAHGRPSLPAMLAVLVGGTFAAGGAHALNCWFDRDIDAEMNRTRRRPLPSGRIPAWHAIVLGIVLIVLAFAVLWVGANLLAAVLALFGALFYVFVYTIWLKRSTPQNIVIGGAAGAMPPLVGWAAATGRLDLTALALFGVV